MTLPVTGRKGQEPMMTPANERTTRLTAAQAIVKYLQVQYSERDGIRQRLVPAMFGIFGHGNVTGIGQALEEYGSELPYYQPCNEQSMVHTAAGFARAKRRLATLACTTSIGPGATNMITGAAAATINRLPVFLFPSDIYANRKQGPVLQQLEHPSAGDVSVNDCFRPVSRFFDRITRPEQILTALPEAMRVLTDPAETGAVTLCLCQDVQPEAFDFPVHFFEEREWRIERRLPDPRRIREAVELLKGARRPLIIAGGGVIYSDASSELEDLSRVCGIPVVETHAGKGAHGRPSDLLAGGLGTTGNPSATKLAAAADLILCVGTRLSDFDTGSQSGFQHPDVRFISINVCGRDAYKQGALPLLADAREALEALSDAAKEAGIETDPSYRREVVEIRRDWEGVCRREVDGQDAAVMLQTQLVRTLQEESQPGDTVIAAAGSPPGDILKFWDATGARHCHLEFGYSCMGYEMPAGLGVRMADPEGEVVVFIGDGTYLMNPTELVTSVQEGLKLTVVVSENRGYQCIRGLQELRSGQAFGNEFRRRNSQTGRLDGDYLEIDYAGNAASMGARTFNVSTEDELRQALRQAREETGTCVIVVRTARDATSPPSNLFWDFMVAEVSNDPLTVELRARYEEERRSQRFHY